MLEPVLPDRPIPPLSLIPGHKVNRSLVQMGPPQMWSALCSCFWYAPPGNLDYVSGAAAEHLRVMWEKKDG